MSEDKEIAEKLQDLLEPHVRLSSQQVQKSQDNQLMNEKSLALDNFNSLALYPRLSIERGIPLSKNMLSQDVLLHQSDSYSYANDQDQGNQENPQQNNYPSIIQEQQWLAEQLSLGLNNVKRHKKYGQNTKNVLRNFGNAQNQYALYNKEAIQIVETELSSPDRFHSWVRTLKLENFDGFKKAWDESGQKEVIAFQRVYKKLCWTFYIQSAIPYVLSSRMRDPKTKISHLKYVYRFLQGIKNPVDFSYFKKIEK